MVTRRIPKRFPIRQIRQRRRFNILRDTEPTEPATSRDFRFRKIIEEEMPK